MNRTRQHEADGTREDKAGQSMLDTPATRGSLRRYGALLFIAAAMLVIWATGLHRECTLENIVAVRDQFRSFLEQYLILSVLAFTLIYIVAVALSLPVGVVLTMSSGLLFGWLLGAVASVVGATIGATVVFLVARMALGEDWIERAGPWLCKLREGFNRDALSYLLFLRLVPAFPFWFVNIAPAILGVPLRTYVVGTFFGIIPGTFAFASAGAGLDSVIMAAKAEYSACVAANGADACQLKIHASSFLTKELMLALVLLGLVALLPIVLKKRRKDVCSQVTAPSD